MGLRLFFLQNFQGTTFIQGVMFIPDSRLKTKYCWTLSTNFFFSKFVDNTQQCVAFTTSSKLFRQQIWIFTEGEGDGIKYRLSSQIFSTLKVHAERLTMQNKIVAIICHNDDWSWVWLEIVYKWNQRVLSYFQKLTNSFSKDLLILM